MPNSGWDGRERRKNVDEDHDLLIGIANDVRHIVDWSKEHDIFDSARFLEMHKRLDEQNKKIEFQQRIVYGGIGIFVFLEFVLKFHN